MRIKKNGIVSLPNGRTWNVQRPLSGDGSQLRAYMEGAEGFSKFGLTEPSWGDTAWDKAKTIGAYIFQKFYWTGTDQYSYGDQYRHALYLLQDVEDAHASDNNGRGPTFSCGAIAYVMSGILTAYGVVSRINYGGTKSGDVDETVELFIPEYGKWVWWHAPTAGYVLLTDGTPASSLELKYAYQNGSYKLYGFRSGTASIQTNTGYDQYGLENSEVWWQGVTGSGNGDTNRAAGGYFYKESWRTTSGYNWDGTVDFFVLTQQDLSPIALDAVGSTRNTPPAPLCDAEDVFPTFNTLELYTVQATVAGYRLDFIHSMLQFDHLESSTDGTTWSRTYGTAISIPAQGTGDLYVRGVDVNGTPTNQVVIVYA